MADLDWADERAIPLAGGIAELEPAIAAALRQAREEGRPKWQTIDTAPRDGTEFQAWVVRDDGRGWWEPRCRINPDDWAEGALNIWGRIDYDEEGWQFYPHLKATHWMPRPTSPGDDK